MATKLTDYEWDQLNFNEREHYLAGCEGRELDRSEMTARESEAYGRGLADSNGSGSQAASGKPAAPVQSDADTARAFLQLVNMEMKQRGCLRCEATEIVATKHPAAHKIFLAVSNPGVPVEMS